MPAPMEKPILTARLRLWLVRIRLKQRAWQLTCLALAQLFRRRAARPALRLLPALLARLPSAWRGGDYQRSRQNLALWRRPDATHDATACHYWALHLLRMAKMHVYAATDTAQRLDWTQGVRWEDPCNYYQRSLEQPTFIYLTHSGEYWLAIGSIVARAQEPTHFIIPMLTKVQFSEHSRKLLEDLAVKGHTIEVIDTHAPGTPMKIARSRRHGKRVIMFADLPAHSGGITYGAPQEARFLQRRATFVKGPLFLASKLQCNALLIGHRSELDAEGTLHVFGWIEAGSCEAMHAAYIEALEGFLREAPEHWHFLPTMEVFFQRQLTPGDLKIALPS